MKPPLKHSPSSAGVQVDNPSETSEQTEAEATKPGPRRPGLRPRKRPAAQNGEDILDLKRVSRFLLYVEKLGAYDGEEAYQLWWPRMAPHAGALGSTLTDEERKRLFLKALDANLKTPLRQHKNLLTHFVVFAEIYSKEGYNGGLIPSDP